ncbi:MAG: hypothetical protein JW749_11665 [Sedimentisphaerales bacterium]|nr:hypothetical protein [Sedimentisphaerales bacterium]
MSDSWSQRLSGVFSLQLTPELIDWFDSEKWRESYSLEFGEPVLPENLLDQGSAEIWGGLMLPDTLPILGNGFGDDIAVRFNSDGSVREFIRWLHETCEWTPAGQSLSQVILFDSARRLLERSSDEDINLSSKNILKWAIRWSGLNSEEKLHLESMFFSHQTFNLIDLLQPGFPEISVRKNLAEKNLETRLLALAREYGGDSIAKKIGVNWKEFEPWLYVPETIPSIHLTKLTQLLGLSEENLKHQDWASAIQHAEYVSQHRSDLGWPFAVMGQAAERKGDFETAAEIYSVGIRALGNTYDFTEPWREYGRGPSKYCAQRLQYIEQFLKVPVRKDEYMLAALDSNFNKVIDYWRKTATIAEEAGKYHEAYNYWYLAGWDHHVFDYMVEILDGLVRVSEQAGFRPFLKLAEHHRKSLS